MNRLHGLAREGFEPTPEEYSRAVTMEHLADLVAQRASETQADTGRSTETGCVAQSTAVGPEDTRTQTSPVPLLEKDPRTRAGFL